MDGSWTSAFHLTSVLDTASWNVMTCSADLIYSQFRCKIYDRMIITSQDLIHLMENKVATN